MQPWAESFYKSTMWQSCRDSVIRRDAFLCVDCLKSGRYNTAEIVHHVLPITPGNIDNPNITLNPENLVSLCRECHALRHGARQRRYTVDEFGRVTIR